MAASGRVDDRDVAPRLAEGAVLHPRASPGRFGGRAVARDEDARPPGSELEREGHRPLEIGPLRQALPRLEHSRRRLAAAKPAEIPGACAREDEVDGVVAPARDIGFDLRCGPAARARRPAGQHRIGVVEHDVERAEGVARREARVDGREREQQEGRELEGEEERCLEAIDHGAALPDPALGTPQQQARYRVSPEAAAQPVDPDERGEREEAEERKGIG